MSERKCVFCNNESTNRFVIADVSSDVCDSCMKGRSNISKVQGVFSRLEKTPESIPVDMEKSYPMSCPSCGTFLQEMIMQMRCGCPECYVTYGEIYDDIDRITSPCKEEGGDSLTGLNIQLEEAIREERYEDANDIKKLMEAMK